MASTLHPASSVSRLHDLGTGDTLVCAGRADLSDPERHLDRVAVAAALDTRADLEAVLRTLLRRPELGHVVLTGDDTTAVGEALVALWHHGLDAEGRVPGPRGRLADDLTAPLLDELREAVTVTDRRGAAPSAVDAAIRDLPAVTPGRDPVDLPDPEVPRRKVFLSRSTSFPIFAVDVGDAWLQLLNLALRVGVDKRSADGDVFAEALNAVVTVDRPLLEDGEDPGTADFPDFFDITADDLAERFVPHHGDRLHHLGGVDQLDAICDRLAAEPDSRDATMVLLTPGEPTATDRAPDLLSATANVVGGKLFMTFVLRRCDCYTGWPLEASALSALHHHTADRLGLEVGSTTFVIHSAHLDQRDVARSIRVLDEHFMRPNPLHVDPSGVFLFGADAAGARAMLLNHDASEIFWEDAFEDPEDLSWYIVDVMPWLLPQHIRYVGQECAALMRAMQAGECYLQG